MTLDEAVSLINPTPVSLSTRPSPGAGTPSSRGVDQPPSRWADLGCGDGLFTKALAHWLAPGSIIYGIDRNPIFSRQTTENKVELIPIKGDFVSTDLGPLIASATPTPPPDIAPLDGILMANSFHYVKNKPALIRRLHPPTFIIVEYDIDRPVPIWVPYPLNYESLHTLFTAEGYPNIRRLADRRSAYGRGNMYAALIS